MRKQSGGCYRFPVAKKSPRTRVKQFAMALCRGVQSTVGHKPTDLALMCCNDRGEISIYVGLGGSNTAVLPLLPPPAQSTCLPVEAVHLHEDAAAAVGRAIEQGHSSEDDSRGYSLSADPAARTKQLSMHDYVATHEQPIEQALQGCADSKQRQAAATLLGYASQSPSQVAALVRASHDTDEAVRNNAVRALWVLAMSNSALRIPANIALSSCSIPVAGATGTSRGCC
jgi:HEAT repeats